MKRKVITFFIILISFLLQSTLFVKLKFGAVSPNLMLVVTSSFGFMRGRKSGMAVGAISGLNDDIACNFYPDIFWGQLLGFHTLLYTVIGYLNGSFERLFYDEDVKLPIVLISASEFLYGICIYVFVYMLQGDFAFGTYLFSIIIPELVYTILVTLILYQVILHINRKLESEEQRSASKFV